MNREQFAQELVKKTAQMGEFLTPSQAEKAILAFMEVLREKVLVGGEKIKIHGYGSFERRKKRHYYVKLNPGRWLKK